MTDDTTPTEVPRIFETERLRYEAIGPEHADHLISLLNDPDVVAALGGARDADWVRRMCDEKARLWKTKGFGPWVVFEKETGDFVGRGGMNECVIDGSPQIEIIGAALPRHWRKGYAAEMGFPTLHAAFEIVGARVVYAFTDRANTAAQGIADMVGATFMRDVEFNGQSRMLYQLSALKWRRLMRKA